MPPPRNTVRGITHLRLCRGRGADGPLAPAQAGARGVPRADRARAGRAVHGGEHHGRHRQGIRARVGRGEPPGGPVAAGGRGVVGRCCVRLFPPSSRSPSWFVWVLGLFGVWEAVGWVELWADLRTPPPRVGAVSILAGSFSCRFLCLFVSSFAFMGVEYPGDGLGLGLTSL